MAIDAHTGVSSPFGFGPKGQGEHFAGEPASGDGHTRLESWKEIGAFFDRDTRTVQLWEKKEGLPVYRHEHAGRPTVYAYREELELWLRTRTQLRKAAIPDANQDWAPAPRPLPAPGSFRSGRSQKLAAAMAAIALFAAALVLWTVRLRTRAYPPAPASGMLAVLPFEDRTPQSSGKAASAPNDFLADGLTDGVITDLGRSGQLRVVSRRTVMQVEGQHASLPAIAAQLHAAAVLEGEVARDHGTVRVTARLVEALDDRQLWAETYRRSDRDVMAWQDDIAAQIATAVTHTLTRGERRLTRAADR